jgi:UDPglucose 6-dehydrogenase
LVYLSESLHLPAVAKYWHAVVEMNEHQKDRFAKKVVDTMFNTITGKRIAVLGFAFKKDTGDTRESAAISLVNHFRAERAHISIYDPEVTESTIMLDLTNYGEIPAESVQKNVKVANSALDACLGANAVVIATEWDEFKTLDWQKIYDSMDKPAFVFDGRLILDREALIKIGFKVTTIGTGAI